MVKHNAWCRIFKPNSRTKIHYYLALRVNMNIFKIATTLAVMLPLVCFNMAANGAPRNINSPMKYIKDAKNIIFISPHPDDIPLTFGGLFQKEDGFKGKNNLYMVFFNKSQYTENDNIKDISTYRVNRVTLARAADNLHALTDLFGPWDNFRMESYGFPDAPLRYYVGPKTAGGGPSGNFSTFRQAEKKTFYQMASTFKHALKTTHNCVVFLLMANGHHIDHYITREALIRAVWELKGKTSCHIFFGEDQPYTGNSWPEVSKEIRELSNRLNLEPVTYPININKKIKVFSKNYLNQYSDEYVKGLKHRYNQIEGERIYYWPIVPGKPIPNAPTCKRQFCQLGSEN